jgi:hypothetical protein
MNRSDKIGKSGKHKEKNNFVVDNPTELLRELAKGVKVKEPVKQELTKASAMMIERKLA